MDFAQRLLSVMQGKGITKYKLSKELKVHQTTIKNWIDGKNEPKAEMISRIAAALDTTPAYLMGWENGKEKKRTMTKLDYEILREYRQCTNTDKLRLYLYAQILNQAPPPQRKAFLQDVMEEMKEGD